MALTEALNDLLSNPMTMQILYVVLGSMGAIGNGLIMAVGIFNKSMRSMEYHFPYLLAFSEFTNNIAILESGIHRMYLILTDQWNMETLHRSDCLWRYFPAGMGLAALMMPTSNFVICIDRLISIRAPVYYYTLNSSSYTKRIGVGVFLAALVYMVALMALSASEVRQSDPFVFAACVPPLILSNFWFNLTWYYNAAISAIVVVLVFVMILSLKGSAARVGQMSAVQEVARLRNERVTRMLIYVLIITVFVYCLPSIALAYFMFYKWPVVYLQIGGVLLTINSVNNIGFYLWKNSDIRNAIKQLLGMKVVKESETMASKA